MILTFDGSFSIISRIIGCREGSETNGSTSLRAPKNSNRTRDSDNSEALPLLVGRWTVVILPAGEVTISAEVVLWLTLD